MTKRIKTMTSALKGSGTSGYFLAAVLLLAPLFTGCAGHDMFAEQAYFKELDRWTRSAKIYEGMESRLYIHATYKSPSYRDAYIERYIRSYSLGSDYRDLMADRERTDGERFNELFITVYTPDDKLNDLDKKDSVWRLYFEDDKGASLPPVSITRVDSPLPLYREFFPYFDLWSRAYIVKFPKYSETGTTPIPGPETRSMKLKVTGVFGVAELEWRLAE